MMDEVLADEFDELEGRVDEMLLRVALYKSNWMELLEATGKKRHDEALQWIKWHRGGNNE